MAAGVIRTRCPCLLNTGSIAILEGQRRYNGSVPLAHRSPTEPHHHDGFWPFDASTNASSVLSSSSSGVLASTNGPSTKSLKGL